MAAGGLQPLLAAAADRGSRGYYRYYIDDANLELDFFHYADEMRELIRECMRFKAEHNLERMGLLETRLSAGRRVALA